jgi:hypothetical protein
MRLKRLASCLQEVTYLSVLSLAVLMADSSPSLGLAVILSTPSFDVSFHLRPHFERNFLLILYFVVSYE